jgi:hypothetical protein
MQFIKTGKDKHLVDSPMQSPITPSTYSNSKSKNKTPSDENDPSDENNSINLDQIQTNTMVTSSSDSIIQNAV